MDGNNKKVKNVSAGFISFINGAIALAGVFLFSPTSMSTIIWFFCCIGAILTGVRAVIKEENKLLGIYGIILGSISLLMNLIIF
jgi:hypothetical protein